MKFRKNNENSITCTISMKELDDKGISPKDLIDRTDEACDILQDIMTQVQEMFDLGEEDCFLEMKFRYDSAHNNVVVDINRHEIGEDNDSAISDDVAVSDDCEITDVDAAELFEKMTNLIDAKLGHKEKDEEKKADSESRPKKSLRCVHALTMREAINIAKSLPVEYVYHLSVDSVLLRDPIDHDYLFLIKEHPFMPEIQGKFPLDEFGEEFHYTSAMMAHVFEHSEKVIQHDALRQLREL